MAEEITYIPYGLDEISQQDLMTSLANGVPGYLDSKRWAKKDKYRLAWLNAYLDIMSRGLLGASNNSGLWNVQYGQDPIDLSTKSNIEREMYQDAAYYIQLQMSLMPLRKKEEEKKKEELDQFDFVNSFGKQLLNLYGGDPKLFENSELGWNTLDARGENGLRGTSKRKEEMAKLLELYKKDLEGKDYNFEGTSFKDKQDALTKLLAAIDALRKTPDDESDDLPAFSALGLNYRGFFSNGGNDIYATDKETGKSITYQEYYGALGKQKEAEAKAKEKVAYDNTLFFNRVTNPKMLGQNPTALKEKYKDHNALFAALLNYAQRDIRALSPLELSEILGAYRYLANQPIDSKTLKNLLSSSSGLYRNAAPNRFRKIKGIDNLIWDDVAKLIIQINSRQQQEAIRNQPEDLFAGVLTSKEVLRAYLDNTEFTEADTFELAGIIADIASIVDPEPWSAGGLGLAAAGARNYARTRGPEDWGISDYFWLGVDYLSGAVGAVPGLGDAALAYKTVRNAAKFLKFALRVPAVYELATSTPGAYQAISKVIKGENPTVEEWMTLGTFFRGLAANRNLNVQNRALRQALLKRGYLVGNKWHLKLGITESKPLNSLKVSTVKVTVDGKPTEIPISKEVKTKLDKELSKAENSAEARSNIIRNNKEVLEAAKKAGIEVKDWSKVTVPYNESLFNMRLFKNKVGLFPKYLRNSGDIYGSTNIETPKNADTFDSYLKGNRGLWDRFKYGSNRTLRGMDRYNKAIHETSSDTPQTQTPTNNSQKALEESAQTSSNNSSSLPKDSRFDKGVMKRYREHLKGNFSNRTILEGSYKFGDTDMNVSSMVNLKNGKITYDIHFGKKHFYNLTLAKAKLKIFDLVKENRKTIDKQSGKSTKKSTAEIGKILLDLKKKGWLKQGGTINTPLDNIIEDFFKNNNI